MNFEFAVTQSSQDFVAVVDVAVRWIVGIALQVGVLDPHLFDVIRDPNHGLPAAPKPDGEGGLEPHEQHGLVMLVVDDVDLLAVDGTNFRT